MVYHQVSEIESDRRTCARRDHRGEDRPAWAGLPVVCYRRMDAPLRTDEESRERDWREMKLELQLELRCYKSAEYPRPLGGYQYTLQHVPVD